MKNFSLLGMFALLFAPLTALAAEPSAIDKAISDAISPIANAISSVIFVSVPVAGTQLPLIVAWLVIAAIVFTLYFGFIQFRVIPQAFRLISGKYDDPSHAGEVSHFQALATAVSGTVGLGNIAGVAVAVTIGGAGATFWMIMAGLLGMASKFTECTLGVKYRNEYADGSVSGGPMYYLTKGLAEQGRAGLGRFLAAFFAICAIGGSIGGGNMFQANQAFQQVVGVTGGDASFFADKGWLFGLVLAGITGAVIIGGIRSIARVTGTLVPFMAILYLGAGLIIILMNLDKLGWAFGQIIDGAFTAEGVTGGVVGALIQGFKRAAFSNEAGIGSASIAHSAVRTNEPATEGIVSVLEPFIDTVVICTMTALVIIITGSLGTEGLSGVQLTSHAFGTNISWFPYILSIAVVLFAFSTIITWSYYGLKAWTYLVGEGKFKELIFKLFFLCFVVIGSSMSLGPVIDFSDSMIFAMSLANIVGLYLLMPVVKREVNSYLARVKSGEIRRLR